MPYTEMHPHTLNSAMYGFLDVNDVKGISGLVSGYKRTLFRGYMTDCICVILERNVHSIWMFLPTEPCHHVSATGQSVEVTSRDCFMEGCA